MNLILFTPSRRFIANRFGLGYQIPLGLVLLGGPLLDAGHQVRLIDNDVLGWSDRQLVQALAQAPPDCLLIGHTGSTAAHPIAMQTAQHVRQAFPQTTIIYGGVYPTYAAQAIMQEHPAVNVIVHGEGEATIVELMAALAQGESLAGVKGITWRNGESVQTNPMRAPIGDLDQYRPGWELIDWAAYQLFGFGRAAGMQFSRGCTLRCTYCGQWSFWRRWRHRSPENFAAELEKLVRDYGVRIVWLADEHFAADREAAHAALIAVAARKLNLSLNLNLTAAAVVRDADLLPLYKEAGVDNVIMGVEALNDHTVVKVHKDNPFAVSQEAVRLLRQNGIVSLVNLIYGLEDETPASLWQTFQRALELDADVLNAVYITPHHWTTAGQAVPAAQIIEHDQRQWTYRNQVIQTPHLRPWQLFCGIKVTEALFHLRPKALWRMIAAPDARYRRLLRAYLATGVRVVGAEVGEFVMRSRVAKALPKLTQMTQHKAGPSPAFAKFDKMPT